MHLGSRIGKGYCDVDPNELVITFGCSYVCANFGENRSRNAHRRTHLQMQTDFYRAAWNGDAV